MFQILLLIQVVFNRHVHRDQSTVTFFLSVGSNWAYDQRHSRENLINAYFHSILAKGGCSLELVKIPSRLFVPDGYVSFMFGRWDGEVHESILSVLIEQVSGFQVVYDCLFHQSQAWTTEDLKMRSMWYIGILAHTDNTFRAALRDYFSSFKSSFNTSSTAISDEVLWSVFDIRTIEELVKAAPVRERSIFLRTVIEKRNATDA